MQGLEANLVIDRDTAYRLGIPAATIDNTLYDAFGQRQVSTLFAPMNEYHVVMEVANRLPAESRRSEEYLCGFLHRHAGSAELVYALRAEDDVTLRQPSGTVSGHHLSFNLAPERGAWAMR